MADWAKTGELTKANALILMGVAYFQPITRGELSQFLGREVSRDAIAALRDKSFIAAGPRQPHARRALRLLEDAGLLGRTGQGALGGDALAAELKDVLGLRGDEEEREENAA